MPSYRRRAMNRRVASLGPILVAVALIVGCNPQAGASGSVPTPSPNLSPAASAATSVHGKATAGPTCPVEPASPIAGQCAPRVVAGAVLVITDAGKHEVTRVTTAADGTFTVVLPTGSYTLTPQPVEGLMGIAAPINFTVPATGTPADLVIGYDTGIR